MPGTGRVDLVTEVRAASVIGLQLAALRGAPSGFAALDNSTGLLVPSYLVRSGQAAPAASSGPTQWFDYVDSADNQHKTRNSAVVKRQVFHWGSGNTFPTVAQGVAVGDRFVHTLYGSVTGVGAGTGPNSYHAYTEFVWNGYSWRQAHVTTVENYADRQAMTAQVKAAGVAAATQPDANVANAIHDGFQVFETSGNRLHVWQGSSWLLAEDNNFGAANTVPPTLYTALTGTPVAAATGFSLQNIYLRSGPGGTAYLDVVVTRTGTAITVPADGGIANTTIATLDAAWCPGLNIPAAATATGVLAQGYLSNAGNLVLANVAPGASLATNAQVQLATMFYPLADPYALLNQ